MQTHVETVDTRHLVHSYSLASSQANNPVDTEDPLMLHRPVLSYSESLRLKMKTADNPTGERLTIREAARRTGYSYEHVRKAYNGETHYLSAEFNEAICKLLGLDKDAMWRVALREKLAARFGTIDTQLPKNSRFDGIWAQLTPEEQSHLTDIAEGLLLAKQATTARELAGVAALPASHAKGSRQKRRH